MNTELFYLGCEKTHTKSHYELRHVHLLRKLLKDDGSEEAKQLLAGLNFVITGDSEYLLPERE